MKGGFAVDEDCSVKNSTHVYVNSAGVGYDITLS
jgi:hypothetical protein